MNIGYPKSTSFLLLPLLALAFFFAPDDARAQPTPVTTIDNAAGDSVLTVFEDGGFAAYGEEGTGTIPIEGQGTRMMWYPAKAAFRVGNDCLTRWDDDNIGSHSVAFGKCPEATGEESTAMGRNTTASGDRSTAMGSNTTASGSGSTAMGFQSTASASTSTAMGQSTTASGHEAMAMGLDTEASGDQSTAMGDGTTANEAASTAMGISTIASGQASTAMGQNTDAGGDRSTAMGTGTTAGGNHSTAMGFQATADGLASTAMGVSTTAETNGSLSLGIFNDANTSADNTLFVVGNGASGSRSDALVLGQSGNLEISGTLTENSDRRLKEQIQPLGDSILGKIGQIRPVRFRFNDERTHPSGTQLGLIAQEVQAQFPELVSEGSSGYLSVSYSKFTAVLLKGLQEQQAEIERLEAKQAEVATLREQNTAIKKRLAKLEQQDTSRRAALGGPWSAAALLAVGLLSLGVLVRRQQRA